MPHATQTANKHALEIIEERLDYLESYPVRDHSHAESLQLRIGELETVRARLIDRNDDEQ